MNVSADFEAEVTVFVVAFRSPDNSYGVVIADADGERVTLVGPVAHLASDDRARVTGRKERHPQRGERIRVLGAEVLDPEDDDGRATYLKSLPGIGPKRAAKLMAALGEEGFAAIDRDPAVAFRKILSRAGAEKAAEAWHDRRASRELHLLLGPLGLARLAAVIEAVHGKAAARVTREDPYSLTALDGFGFPTADAIARAVGFEDVFRRQQAACLHVLSEAAREGNTFVPAELVLERAGALLSQHVESDVTDGLVAANDLVEEDGRLYLFGIHRLETDVADEVTRRAGALHLVEDADRDAELSAEQLAAADHALTAGITVVTGGPGTGKTHLIAEIVRRAAEQDLDVALCAPTGKAARRVSEATDHAASTVHRLLGWGPGGPAHDAHDPIAADVVICDESSMLTLALFGRLLDALEPGARLVLVGDADQLPPIGAGQPFADVIASGTVPVHRLTEIFRQAKRSLLVRAAHEVNSGRAPAFAAGEGDTRDLFLIGRTDPAALVDEIVSLTTTRLPSHYELEGARDVLVLAPMHKGPAGVTALNEVLRAQLNPSGAPAFHKRFRIGDRLLATRNDYDAGLMNGELVALVDDDAQRQRLLVSRDGDVLSVSYESAGLLALGYATTVHKAQGSESPAVVIALHRSAMRMLTRPLLYTALTRAKRVCCVVGDGELLGQAAARTGERRYSSLAMRLGGGKRRFPP